MRRFATGTVHDEWDRDTMMLGAGPYSRS